MAFYPHVTDIQKDIVKNAFINRKSGHRRYIDKITTSFDSLSRFSVYDKASLEVSAPEPCPDTLEIMEITKSDTKTITFMNPLSGESYQIDFNLVAINYQIIIAKYTHFSGMTGKVVTERDYKYTEETEQHHLTITIGDLFKHYYYNHRDEKNLGIVGINPHEAKQLADFIKKHMSTEAKTNNVPFAIYDRYLNIYKIKGNKIKWTVENFLGQQLIVEYNCLKSSELVLMLLQLYHNGSYVKPNNSERIVFEKSKSFVEVIEQYEDLKEHDIRKTYNLITKKLTTKQKKELDTRYTDFVISDKWESCAFNRSKKVGKEAYISYPLYAFRNIYVKEWFTNGSIYSLIDIVRSKYEQSRSQKINYLEQKKGRHIDKFESRKYASLFNGPARGYHGCEKDWLKFLEKRQRNKDKRAQKYEIKESKSMY